MQFIRYSAATDVGLQRSNNEDCYLSNPANGLWLVADGMGGHAAGEVASAIASKTIEQSVMEGKNLKEAIQNAHHAILHAAARGEGGQGMGSTVVALLEDGDKYQIGWVGDSRAYIWSTDLEPNLYQLTRDHSYVQMLLDTGAIHESELATHPEKNIITQCLGSLDLDNVEVDIFDGKWERDDIILLCSDGLTDAVSNDKIRDILAQSENVQVAARTLIQTALDSGGRDNITVSVIASPNSAHRFIQATVGRLQKLFRRP